MVKPITIQDNGNDRYTVISTINTLGRRYDNNAESIVVNFPQSEIEAGHICTMIVTAYGKVIDHIEVENGVEVPITSNLSQYSEIKIGFSFTDDEGYVKNSEIKTFKFLEAQKPDGFVPEPPQQSGSIDRLIRSGFVDVGQQGSYVIFYNMAHEEVARIRIQGGGGGGGCTVYVNGEEVDELLFTSDPQTQITALAEAMTLVQNSLSEKATIKYVDERFNGANKALSYGDYETMITAFNALDDDVYNVGQNVYIVTREVPDLWISSVEETSVPYTYVDDATFVSALSTTGYVQVGYYKFSALETEKVDLTNYVPTDTDQTITGEKNFAVGLQVTSRNDYKWGLSPTAGGASLQFGRIGSTDGQYNIYPLGIRPNANNQILGYLNKFARINVDEIASTHDGTPAKVQDIIDGTFNVINASDIASTNILTEAQIAIITNGKPTIIKGTFRGYTDAIYKKPVNYGTVSVGVFEANNEIGGYIIQSSGLLEIRPASTTVINLRSIGQINGKTLDYYFNNVYPYATNSTTTLQYETINDISVSADTTFTLATAPTNTYPEYKANITNSGANDITITLPSGTAIKGNVSISSNTFVIPSGSTVELNICNSKALVVDWTA